MKKGSRGKKNKSNKNQVSDEENLTKTNEQDQGGQVEEPVAKKKKTVKVEEAAAETDEIDYEVEEILDSKQMNGTLHYLIKWKGFEETSWESKSCLDCPILIKEFESKQREKQLSSGSRGKNQKKSENGKVQSGKIKSQKTTEEFGDENYEVDRIIEVSFKKDGKRDFLVSWKGYPSSQNTWEPEENLDCPELLSKFMIKVEKAREFDAKELRFIRKQTDRFASSENNNKRRVSRRNSGKRVSYREEEY